MALKVLFNLAISMNFLLSGIHGKNAILNYTSPECVSYEENHDKLVWKLLTSLSDIQYLVDIEEKILQINGIQEFMDSKDATNDFLLLKHFLVNLRDHYSRTSNPYVHHFLNQYHVLRRFAYDWPNILANQRNDLCLQHELCGNIVEIYDEAIQSVKSKSIEKETEHSNDWLIKTILLILLNQGAHNLTLENYRTGIIGETKTMGLSSFELLEFSIVSTLIKDLVEECHDCDRSTPFWFHGALYSFNNSLVNEIRSVGDINTMVDKIYYDKAEYSRGNIVSMNTIYKLINLVGEEIVKHNFILQPDLFYEELCSKTDSDIQIEDDLFCYYQYNYLPYYRFKAEMFTRNFSIILIHDFMNNHQLMEDVQSSFLKDLSPSQVLHETNGSMLCFNRLAKTTALPDELQFSQQFDFNSKQLYGINSVREGELFSTEALSLVNYGVHGYYFSHFDAFGFEEDKDASGNRIMTLMLYLTDVELGGGTIFPHINQISLAKRGRALLWFNIDESGRELEVSEHEACPVVIGDKWIVTKWIREFSHDHLKVCRKYI